MSRDKALFLDRDGVINIDTGYLHKQEDFIFTDAIFELLKIFVGLGYKIFVLTNQSGIGRGYYSEDDFKNLTVWMAAQFEYRGIEINGVQYCPHLPDSGCRCRKPKSGMVDAICKEYDIDLKGSWMIGDKPTDIEMAKVAEIGRSILIGDRGHEADYTFGSVRECKEFLELNKDKIAL